MGLPPAQGGSKREGRSSAAGWVWIGGCGGIGFLWEIKNDFAICVHWFTVRMGAH